MAEDKTDKKKLHKKASRYVLPLVGIVVIIVAAVITILVLKNQPPQVVDASKYQVVYLTNGQMYFGKLQNISGDFLVVKTPYAPQDTTGADTGSNSNQGALLKVSDQLYGPEDSIAIKSSQVAFWQNLRDDSKVTQAIKAKE